MALDTKSLQDRQNGRKGKDGRPHMDWFRVDSDLPRHPHLLRVARKLSITKTQAMGHILALWCAVAEHAEDGVLRGVDDEMVELWSEWPDVRRGEFVAAMREVGWIDPKNTMSGWAKRHEYMINERNRKRRQRLAKPDAARAARAQSDGRGARRPEGGAPDAAQPTVPYRTVPDRTKEETTTAAPAAAPASGALFDDKPDAPKKQAKPRKPTDPRIAQVNAAFREAYTERFGIAPTITDYRRVGGQITAALKAIGGEDPAAELIGLIGRYLDLADSDPFYEGAPLDKFLMGATLTRLRAVKAGPREESYADWLRRVS